MRKHFNTRVWVGTLIVLGLLAILFFFLRSCGRERMVHAFVSHTEIIVGESISFRDSTQRAGSWLWEFGNGDYSVESSGEYAFSEEGTYRIRLRVDGIHEKYFTVRVKPNPQQDPLEHLVRIHAPILALQGEFILFTAEGNDQEWRWEFGETGITDSREKTAIYAYQFPGQYEVRLSSENTLYPVIHEIEILPKYMENDSLDATTIAGNDIKIHLQAIVDGRPFNPAYNHILHTYLCSDPDVLVTVNNNKRNDFYSYCQGLRLAGRGNTVIETVYAESSDPESGCVDHLIVMQYDRAERMPSSPSPKK